jgi:hypothetical protein
MEIMTPESAAKEQKRLKEDRDLYPPFIVEGLKTVREQIHLEEQTWKSHQRFSKIEDFIQLIRSVWKLSSKTYQKEYWNKHGQWGDNYSETMETFLGDAEAVLEANEAGRVEVTPTQREMLEKFYTMMDDFDGDGDSADDPGYGINDAAIIEDPKFAKCRQYAKLVYEELSGDDLDAWEKQRDMG